MDWALAVVEVPVPVPWLLSLGRLVGGCSVWIGTPQASATARDGRRGGGTRTVPHVVRGRHASHKLQLPTSKGAGAGAAELCRWSLPVLRSFPFTLPRAAGEGAATSTLKLAPAPPANHFCRCLILPLFRLWHHHAHSSIVHPRFPLSSTTVGLQQA